MNKQFKNILYIFIIIFVGALIYVGVRRFSEADIIIDQENPSYTISHDSGFYDHSIRLKIKAENCRIYYTTDGSEPSDKSDSSILYTEPLNLIADTQEVCHHFRVRFYDEKNIRSKIYDFTYWLGTSIDERYSTHVVHISGDPVDLFSHESGIFVAGKLREDFLNEHPEIEEAKNTDPANYNLRGPESERAVNFQLFDSEGNLLTSQNCGLRITGNYSRGYFQKSFQLFARNRYDDYGKFHTTLFTDITSPIDGTIPTKNNRLVFRNSGNDFGKAFIRDTLVQELSMDAGFPMCTPYIPVTVYINNDYYGFYWMKEPFSNGQMEELYGAYNGIFEEVSINESAQLAFDSTETLSSDYQKIYDTFTTADLTDDATFNALCQKIDVDNYLLYYAIQLYIANKDWPFSNVRAYRYVANDNVYYENTLMDGKYRYYIFDTDFTLGFIDELPGFTVDEDNVAYVTYGDHSLFFKNLIKREDCKQKFISYACDIMNTSFFYANIEATMNELQKASAPELSYFAENVLFDAINVDMETINAIRNDILTFVQERPGYFYSFLQTNLAIGNSYLLNITGDNRIKTSVNSIASVLCNDMEGYTSSRNTNFPIVSVTNDNGQTINTFSGIYYADCALYLRAQVDEGHTFSHWDINGQIYTTPVLTLSSDELKELLIQTNMPAADGSIAQVNTLNVNIVQNDKNDSTPIISRIHSKDENDMVELYNPYEHDITLNNFYLSDDETNLKKTKLPNKILSSRESYFLYGEKNTAINALLAVKLGFNLRKEETLYLSDENGNILEEIWLPDMARVDTFYVRNPYTGKFIEQ